MGTRSLTHIKDERETTICTIYRQMDGYPDGHGRELAEFCKDLSLVNGIGFNERNIANGMGCLAAQIVAHFKKGPGGIYLFTPNSSDHGEEYIYTIKQKEGQIWIECRSARSDDTHIEGTARAFLQLLT